MTENTVKPDSPQKTDLTADDLSLVDDRLADASKDEAELWEEFDVADDPNAVKDDAAKPDDGANSPDFATDGQDGETGEDTGEAAQAKDTGQDGDNDDGEGQSSGDDADKTDIWADATPEQRAELERLQETAKKAEQEAKRQSSRQSALQRRVNELQKRLGTSANNGEDGQPTDAIARIEEDYPELAEPLKQALTPLAERMTKADEERLAAKQADQQAAQEELVEIVTEQTNILLETHPDYEEFLGKNGAAFGAWVEDQPKRIRDAAYRNASNVFDAEGAIEVLNAFKAHMQPKPADEPAPASKPQETQPLNDRRQRQLDGSASPKSHAGRPTVSGIPKEGDPQAIWDAFDAQEQRSSA